MALLVIACGRAVPAFAGDAAPAPSGQHQAGSAASRPATAPARPASAAPKKVWTAEDLARLRQTSRAPITVAAVPTPEIPSATTTQAADPGVVKRLQEVLGESDAALQRLDRERLASLNPFMRGLSRDPQGKPVAPRPVAEIEAEREQWVSRQAVAKATLERLARAANRPPEEYLPTAPDPADPGAPAAPKP